MTALTIGLSAFVGSVIGSVLVSRYVTPRLSAWLDRSRRCECGCDRMYPASMFDPGALNSRDCVKRIRAERRLAELDPRLLR